MTISEAPRSPIPLAATLVAFTGLTLADPIDVCSRRGRSRSRWRGGEESTQSTRVGGRKVYAEGPYVPSSPVSGERRESLPSACGGPGLFGRFRVARSEVDPRPLDDWAQRAEVRVRVRIAGGRACHFVLPLRHS